ncbi:MAG: hypothetical protein AVDCRST_MAG89-2797, partial [uncultured Gemmatimonadetes bacterium]
DAHPAHRALPAHLPARRRRRLSRRRDVRGGGRGAPRGHAVPAGPAAPRPRLGGAARADGARPPPQGHDALRPLAGGIGRRRAGAGRARLARAEAGPGGRAPDHRRGCPRAGAPAGGAAGRRGSHRLLVRRHAGHHGVRRSRHPPRPEGGRFVRRLRGRAADGGLPLHRPARVERAHRARGPRPVRPLDHGGQLPDAHSRVRGDAGGAAGGARAGDGGGPPRRLVVGPGVRPDESRHPAHALVGRAEGVGRPRAGHGCRAGGPRPGTPHRGRVRGGAPGDGPGAGPAPPPRGPPGPHRPVARPRRPADSVHRDAAPAVADAARRGHVRCHHRPVRALVARRVDAPDGPGSRSGRVHPPAEPGARGGL